jgi:hypothetical protein
MATIMHRRADEPTTGRSGYLLALGTPPASRLVADVRARAAPVNGLNSLAPCADSERLPKSPAMAVPTASASALSSA